MKPNLALKTCHAARLTAYWQQRLKPWQLIGLACLAGLYCGPSQAQTLQWVRVATHEVQIPASAVPNKPAALPVAPESSTQAATVDSSKPLRLAAAYYVSLVNAMAKRYALDPLLIHAVIHVESAYRTNALSPKGAIGLMQVMPATGRRFGKISLASPADNIEAGSAYLSWLLEHFNGRLDLALAGYNAGEKAVAASGNIIPPFNETRQYVKKVLAVYNSLKNQPVLSAWIANSVSSTNPKIASDWEQPGARDGNLIQVNLHLATPITHPTADSDTANQGKTGALEQVVSLLTGGYAKPSANNSYCTSDCWQNNDKTGF